MKLLPPITKFQVLTNEHSIAPQNKLGEMGFRWNGPFDVIQMHQGVLCALRKEMCFESWAMIKPYRDLPFSTLDDLFSFTMKREMVKFDLTDRLSAWAGNDGFIRMGRDGSIYPSQDETTSIYDESRVWKLEDLEKIISVYEGMKPKGEVIFIPSEMVFHYNSKEMRHAIESRLFEFGMSWADGSHNLSNWTAQVEKNHYCLSINTTERNGVIRIGNNGTPPTHTLDELYQYQWVKPQHKLIDVTRDLHIVVRVINNGIVEMCGYDVRIEKIRELIGVYKTLN